MLLTVIGVSLGLDLGAFILTQHVPEDAVFNLGPVLGLLREGRMSDLLVYKEFYTYYGYPPLFFLPQTLWHALLGIDSGLVWGWVVVTHISLIVCFVLVFRRYIQNPVLLGLLAMCYCSGVYYLSGRPDPVSLLLIFPLAGCLLRLMDIWDARYLWYSALYLLAIFFIHPLAFLLSGFVFFGALLLTYRRLHLKYLLVTGLAIVGCILTLYLPFVFADLPSWKALFLDLAKNQERFKLSGLVKFSGLNAGALLAMTALAATGGWRSFSRLFYSNLFPVALVAMMIPFLWGASYYFLFVLPFILAPIVRMFTEDSRSPHWLYVLLLVGLLLSVYQGSLGKVIQGLRNPEYGAYLSGARKKVAEAMPPDGSVYADYQLVADITHVADINLLWHGMKYHRKNLGEDPRFVFVMESSWVSNQKLLGDWNDTTRYYTLWRGERIRGLPALYRKLGTGPDLQLILVLSK
jgi:hypothetical protein